MRTYSELINLDSFIKRYEYLKLDGVVGNETFGFDRYLNQVLYKSPEWKKTRNEIIIRDDGCDLGIKDRIINGRILIHHLNPITYDDIVKKRNCIFDPENLICVSHRTHNSIHYGDLLNPINEITNRTPGDTLLW